VTATWYDEAIANAEARGNKALVIVVPYSPDAFDKSGRTKDELAKEASAMLMRWLSAELHKANRSV
jgi:hypothetical protein